MGPTWLGAVRRQQWASRDQEFKLIFHYIVGELRPAQAIQNPIFKASKQTKHDFKRNDQFHWLMKIPCPDIYAGH